MSSCRNRSAKRELAPKERSRVRGKGNGARARATHLSEVHDVDFGERVSRTAHLVGYAAHDGVHDAVADVRQVGPSGCRANGEVRHPHDSQRGRTGAKPEEEDSHEPDVRRKNGCSNSSGMEARCFGSNRKQLLRVVSKSGPTWNLCSLKSSPRFPIGTAYSGKLIRVDGLEMAAILMAMSRRWENGAPPYTIWYRMQPSDQTSAARPSYIDPRGARSQSPALCLPWSAVEIHLHQALPSETETGVVEGFRRHVVGGPDLLVAANVGRIASDRFRDTKVDQLQPTFHQHKVGRLEVAVHDRFVVDDLDGRQHLHREPTFRVNKCSRISRPRFSTKRTCSQMYRIKLRLIGLPA